MTSQKGRRDDHKPTLVTQNSTLCVNHILCVSIANYCINICSVMNIKQLENVSVSNSFTMTASRTRQEDVNCCADSRMTSKSLITVSSGAGSIFVLTMTELKIVLLARELDLLLLSPKVDGARHLQTRKHNCSQIILFLIA